MNTFVKNIVIAFFAWMPVLPVFAQQQRTRTMSVEARAQRETEMMKEELKLTDTQLHKVDSVNLLYAKKMDEVMASGDREKMRSAMETNATNKDKAFKAILTDDQYKQLKAKEEELRQQMRRERPR